MESQPMFCQMLEPMYMGRKYWASLRKAKGPRPILPSSSLTMPEEENMVFIMPTTTTVDRKWGR